MKKFLTLLLFLAPFTVAQAFDEFLKIPSPESGFFSNSSPTPVMYWDNFQVNSVVAFVPGGDGSGLIKGFVPKFGMRGIGKTVTLIDGAASAFIDSPISLGTDYSASGRFTSSHIQRVVSVVKVLHEKTGKPIWLYGHSNGSISVFEVHKALQASHEENLLAGLIVSGARDIIRPSTNIGIPVLFIHHRDDACADTPLYQAKKTFEQIHKNSPQSTEFVTVTTPIAHSGNPCLSGIHMFDNDYGEIAQIIGTFIQAHQP